MPEGSDDLDVPEVLEEVRDGLVGVSVEESSEVFREGTWDRLMEVRFRVDDERDDVREVSIRRDGEETNDVEESSHPGDVLVVLVRNES